MAIPEYDATYRRIKETALRLFAERGYVATGIRTIAEEAGFSATALYHHVANKEELLTDLMRQGIEVQIGNARAALAGERRPEAKLAVLAAQHVRFETVHQTLSTVTTVEYHFLSAEAQGRIRPLREAYESIWREVVDEGIRAGAFRVSDAGLATLALIEMCSAPEAWYRQDGRLSVDEIAALFSTMALDLVQARVRASGSGSAPR